MVTIVDSRNSSAPAMYESGNFVYDTATKPVTFNDTDTFNYQQKALSYVMNGTIRVINQPNPLIPAPLRVIPTQELIQILSEQ